DGRVWQRYVEGHAVVFGGERFEVGADLVGHVAIGRHAVRANDADVDFAGLHEVAAGIVDDDRVRDAMTAELVSCQRGALVAWPRLVHPDMHGNASIVGVIDGRGRGAPV